MYSLLQINSVANWGSTGKIAESLGQEVLKDGNISYIAYGRQCNPSTSKLIKIGSKWDVLCHILYTKITDRHGLASSNSTKQLISQIEKIKPDIIHLHNIHGYYINYALLFDYLSQLDIPIVWTLHDCWSFTGHCAHFEKVSCMKWKSGCNKCVLSRNYPSSFVDSSSYNYLLKSKIFTSIKNLTIVTVSNWLANYVKQSFLSQYNVRVIYNGIDLDKFKQQDKDEIFLKYNIPRNKNIVLGVSNVWTESKGFFDFIRLARLLDSTYQVVLVGVNKSQRRKLSDGIIGIERTTDFLELKTLYSRALVFVNLTYGDSFPTTNLEALAAGTPIVTYRTGGCPEAVSDDTGFVVEKGDLNGVLDCVSLIKNKGKESFSVSCRNRASNLFDKKVQNKEYIKLYNELLKK